MISSLHQTEQRSLKFRENVLLNEKESLDVHVNEASCGSLLTGQNNQDAITWIQSPISLKTCLQTAKLLNGGISPKVLFSPIPKCLSWPKEEVRKKYELQLVPIEQPEKIEKKHSSQSIEENSLNKRVETCSSPMMYPQTLDGERRLIIHFENLGKIEPKKLQTYGKDHGFAVPNGLSGTHSMYNEPWKFEIQYDEQDLNNDCGLPYVRLTWKVTNLTTGLS